MAGHFQVDTQGLLYAGVSLAVHAGLLAAMAFFMPPMGSTDEDGISSDQQYMMQQYLQAAAEKEAEAKETEQTAYELRCSFAIIRRSRWGSVLGCSVVNLHLFPGGAPQVGQRTKSACFGASFFTMKG